MFETDLNELLPEEGSDHQRQEHVSFALKGFADILPQSGSPSSPEPPRQNITIPVSRPALGEEELAAVAEVFSSGWLGHGEKVLQFETALSEMMGGRQVVATSSGTSALHLALDALAIGPGDEVIVPSLTFCASVQAITAVGATPIFCEVELQTLNIDLEDLRKRISSRTRAIMPVHFCGNPCDMDTLLSLTRPRGIVLVEDAAHAFGSSDHGRLLGSFGDITCFSFDPIKNITCGEGGAVVLDNSPLVNSIRRKRLLGMDREHWQRDGVQRGWWYTVETQGYRYHMSNINAAIGLVQLGKLPQFRARRREIISCYNAAFSTIPGIELLKWNMDACCPFSYMLLIADNRRDGLVGYLGARGIGSSVHYVPNHLQPYFSAAAVSLPKTERIYREVITLPLYSNQSDYEVKQVIEAVLDFFQEN